MGQDPEHGIEPAVRIAGIQSGLDVQCHDAIDDPVQLRELLHGRRPADIEFGRYPHDGNGPASMGRCCDQHLAEILRGSSAQEREDHRDADPFEDGWNLIYGTHGILAHGIAVRIEHDRAETRGRMIAHQRSRRAAAYEEDRIVQVSHRSSPCRADSGRRPHGPCRRVLCRRASDRRCPRPPPHRRAERPRRRPCPPHRSPGPSGRLRTGIRTRPRPRGRDRRPGYPRRASEPSSLRSCGCLVRI